MSFAFFMNFETGLVLFLGPQD